MIKAFLSSLAKADPDAAMEAVAVNLKGAMTVEGLEAMWEDADIGLTLNNDLLTLLVSEGNWIVSRGVVKAEQPTPDSMSPFLTDGPLKSVDPSMVCCLRRFFRTSVRLPQAFASAAGHDPVVQTHGRPPRMMGSVRTRANRTPCSVPDLIRDLPERGPDQVQGSVLV